MPTPSCTRTFNHSRIRPKLNGLSPVEYRTQVAQA
ncbi:IS3 family transposase [Pseudomonas sp. CVAP